MATTMTSTTIVPFLFLATTVLLFFGTTDAQICYGRYGSANRFSLNQGQCRYAIGGIRRIRGVFIKSYMSCCRRPQAEGWGYHYSCKPCNAIRGQLRPWSQWSPCSRSCGMGRQTRSRVCTTNVCVGMRQKQVVETRACSWNACCPVDGGWSQWSQSTGCSVTCGPGFEYRIRSCKAPTPECGGLPCVGTGKQYKECFVNCATWAQWTTQGSCSRSCGNGTMLRQRECIRPFGGVCQGPPVDNVACNNGPCPKSGNWCPWSSWGKCSSNCTELQNTMKRTRSCSCPSPGFLGLPCQGPEVESMPCQGEEICSYDGNWNSWSGWSGCSAITCSVRKGRRVRKRVCDNPAPYLNGADCFGDAFQESTCLNMTECYVDGMTDNWSAWSPCSTSCGSCGKVSRWRKCVSPFRNPAVWAVQAVIGNPRLSCGKELMNETKDCTFITCPDGVDPCAPTTTPPPSSTLPTAVYIKSNEVIGAVVRSTPSSSTPGGRQTLRNKNIILHGGAYMTSSQQQVYTTTRAELETKSEEVVSDGRWDDNEVSLLAQLIKSTLRSPDVSMSPTNYFTEAADATTLPSFLETSHIPSISTAVHPAKELDELVVMSEANHVTSDEKIVTSQVAGSKVLLSTTSTTTMSGRRKEEVSTSNNFVPTTNQDVLPTTEPLADARNFMATFEHTEITVSRKQSTPSSPVGTSTTIYTDETASGSAIKEIKGDTATSGNDVEATSDSKDDIESSAMISAKSVVTSSTTTSSDKDNCTTTDDGKVEITAESLIQPTEETIESSTSKEAVTRVVTDTPPTEKTSIVLATTTHANTVVNEVSEQSSMEKATTSMPIQPNTESPLSSGAIKQRLAKLEHELEKVYARTTKASSLVQNSSVDVATTSNESLEEGQPSEKPLVENTKSHLLATTESKSTTEAEISYSTTLITEKSATLKLDPTNSDVIVEYDQAESSTSADHSTTREATSNVPTSSSARENNTKEYTTTIMKEDITTITFTTSDTLVKTGSKTYQPIVETTPERTPLFSSSSLGMEGSTSITDNTKMETTILPETVNATSILVNVTSNTEKAEITAAEFKTHSYTDSYTGVDVVEHPIVTQATTEATSDVLLTTVSEERKEGMLAANELIPTTNQDILPTTTQIKSAVSTLPEDVESSGMVKLAITSNPKTTRKSVVHATTKVPEAATPSDRKIETSTETSGYGLSTSSMANNSESTDVENSGLGVNFASTYPAQFHKTDGYPDNTLSGESSTVSMSSMKTKINEVSTPTVGLPETTRAESTTEILTSNPKLTRKTEVHATTKVPEAATPSDRKIETSTETSGYGLSTSSMANNSESTDVENSGLGVNFASTYPAQFHKTDGYPDNTLSGESSTVSMSSMKTKINEVSTPTVGLPETTRAESTTEILTTTTHKIATSTKQYKNYPDKDVNLSTFSGNDLGLNKYPFFDNTQPNLTTDSEKQAMVENDESGSTISTETAFEQLATSAGSLTTDSVDLAETEQLNPTVTTAVIPQTTTDSYTKFQESAEMLGQGGGGDTTEITAAKYATNLSGFSTSTTPTTFHQTITYSSVSENLISESGDHKPTEADHLKSLDLTTAPTTSFNHNTINFIESESTPSTSTATPTPSHILKTSKSQLDETTETKGTSVSNINDEEVSGVMEKETVDFSEFNSMEGYFSKLNGFLEQLKGAELSEQTLKKEIKEIAELNQKLIYILTSLIKSTEIEDWKNSLREMDPVIKHTITSIISSDLVDRVVEQSSTGELLAPTTRMMRTTTTYKIADTTTYDIPSTTNPTEDGLLTSHSGQETIGDDDEAKSVEISEIENKPIPPPKLLRTTTREPLVVATPSTTILEDQSIVHNNENKESETAINLVDRLHSGAEFKGVLTTPVYLQPLENMNETNESIFPAQNLDKQPQETYKQFLLRDEFSGTEPDIQELGVEMSVAIPTDAKSVTDEGDIKHPETATPNSVKTLSCSNTPEPRHDDIDNREGNKTYLTFLVAFNVEVVGHFADDSNASFVSGKLRLSNGEEFSTLHFKVLNQKSKLLRHGGLEEGDDVINGNQMSTTRDNVCFGRPPVITPTNVVQIEEYNDVLFENTTSEQHLLPASEIKEMQKIEINEDEEVEYKVSGTPKYEHEESGEPNYDNVARPRNESVTVQSLPSVSHSLKTNPTQSVHVVDVYSTSETLVSPSSHVVEEESGSGTVEHLPQFEHSGALEEDLESAKSYVAVNNIQYPENSGDSEVFETIRVYPLEAPDISPLQISDKSFSDSLENSAIETSGASPSESSGTSSLETSWSSSSTEGSSFDSSGSYAALVEGIPPAKPIPSTMVTRTPHVLKTSMIYVDVDASRKREAESSDVVVLEDGSSIPNVEDETPVVLESSDSLDPDVFDRHHLDLSQQLEQITNEKELGEFFTEYFASSKVIRSVTEHDQAFYESPIYSGSSDHKSKEDYGSEINYESKDSSYGDYDMKEKSDRDYITESLDSDSDTKGYVSEMTTYDDPKESPDSDEEYDDDYGNNGNYGNTAERSWYSYNEENYEAEEDPGFQVDENNKDLGEVNCMLQSIDDDYTPEINRCCLLLSKNVTNTTDMQKFDHCLVLQMEIGYGAGPEDVQKRWMGDVAERNKCVVRNNKRALLTFCCHKKSCREWSKPVLRKTCKACRPICPPCFSKILYG